MGDGRNTQRATGRERRKRRQKGRPAFRLPAGLTALYGVDGDIVYAGQGGAAPSTHVSYAVTSRTGQRRRRSIDYFVEPGALTRVSAKEYPIDLVLEAKAGVHCTIPEEFAQAVDLIRGISAAHIRAHLADRYHPNAMPDMGTVVECVAVVPPPAPTIAGPARLRPASKVIFKRACRYSLQIDFSKGCAAATEGGYTKPENACQYCYGCSNRFGSSRLLHVDEKRVARQLAKLTPASRVVCVGMQCDPGAGNVRDELLAFLDLCPANDLIPVVRTKLLDRDERVAKKLVACGGVLVVSFGNDGSETGVVLQGASNERRLEVAAYYRDLGVNSVAGMLIDPAQPSGGPHFERMLSRVLAESPNVILYALRAKTSQVAEKFFGADFKMRMTPTGAPAYERHGSLWVASCLHPTIAQLIGNNRGAARLCLASTAGQFCGACHLPGKAGTITQATPSMTAIKPLVKASPNGTTMEGTDGGGVLAGLRRAP